MMMILMMILSFSSNKQPGRIAINSSLKWHYLGDKWPKKTLMILILFTAPGVLHFVFCEGRTEEWQVGGGGGGGQERALFRAKRVVIQPLSKYL